MDSTTDRQSGGWTNKQMEGRAVRWTDEYMDEWPNGQMDGWTN